MIFMIHHNPAIAINLGRKIPQTWSHQCFFVSLRQWNGTFNLVGCGRKTQRSFLDKATYTLDMVMRQLATSKMNFPEFSQRLLANCWWFPQYLVDVMCSEAVSQSCHVTRLQDLEFQRLSVLLRRWHPCKHHGDFDRYFGRFLLFELWTLVFHAVNGVSDCGPLRESCKIHARQGSKRQSTQILIGHWSRTADPCGSCPVHGGCHGISHARIRRCNQRDSCLASNSSWQIVEVSQFSGWEPSGDFRFFSSANPCCFHF